MKVCIRRNAATLLAVIALCVIQGGASATPSAVPLSPQQDEQLVAAQYAATHGDRSQIAKSIKDLQQSIPSSQSDAYTMGLMYPLSVQGATEALPAFDQAIKTIKDPDVVCYAKVARARLVAEDAARAVADPSARARAKVARFYQELGLTPQAINTAAADYKAQMAQMRSGPIISDPEDPPHAIALDALPALVDMVYQSGDYDAYARLPLVSQVDFSAFLSTTLKWRLAPLSRPQRIATLVQELAARKRTDRVDMAEDYKLQLLEDEGPAARLAAEDQLKVLDVQNRASAATQDPRYRPLRAPGWDTLYLFLETSGGTHGVITCPRPIVTGY